MLPRSSYGFKVNLRRNSQTKKVRIKKEKPEKQTEIKEEPDGKSNVSEITNHSGYVMTACQGKVLKVVYMFR